MINNMIMSTPAYLLVFARMGGLLGMNPMLSRRNVPVMVRTGLTMLMTVLIAPNVTVAENAYNGSLGLAMAMAQELLVGLACGFVFQIFYYLLLFAGDLMDIQFGMSMAKVFDPGTNIQMSLSGNILNIWFILYIFATDSHLLMIRIFASSFQILPAGAVSFSQEAAGFFLKLFIAAFSMALRLTLPFIAAEFVLELCMGVLMKLIPQIHVFVINIQFKIILGLVLLLAFASPIGSFLDNYMRIMFENMQYAFQALGG